MISAIANPFLYGYFNETFRDGLEKIFSLCCPQLNREIKQICYEQADLPTCQPSLKRCPSDATKSPASDEPASTSRPHPSEFSATLPSLLNCEQH